MPVITAPNKQTGSQVVTEFVDTVGTVDTVYSFPDATTRDTLKIDNLSSSALTVTAGAQTITVDGFKSEKITDVSFAQFTVKAVGNNGSFRARSSFKSYDEEDEKELSQNVTARLASITYNITEFPRLNVETNDYNRFIRAFSAMKNGDTLSFDGIMDFGSQALAITKEIQLKGKNIGSSIVKDGLINIKASNVTCSNFFIDAINYADGFKVNDTACENILIKNCKTNVKSHGYLFESYNGLVKNVIVENCIAENGLHGFVNKASNVTFKNCRAKNITYLGFGCISDNIQGVDKIAQCENAIIENCKAFTCGAGFSTYIRDKFNNTVSFECKNININGMFIDGCNQALSLGEETIPADYLAISDIKNINLANINITNSVFEYYGIFVNRILNVNVININCDSYTRFMNGTTNQMKAKFNQVPFIQSKVNSANISSGNVTLDIYSCKNYDILISSNNTNVISTTNQADGDEITLMIRATTDATFTFGGFGTMFTVPTSVIPSVKFGDCMVTKWMYNRWVSKFICTAYFISRSH